MKYLKNALSTGGFSVLPLAREWIEIYDVDKILKYSKVLPLTREWIEMT